MKIFQGDLGPVRFRAELWDQEAPSDFECCLGFRGLESEGLGLGF